MSKHKVTAAIKQPETRVLFTEKKIAQRVRLLAQEISTDYEGCDLVIVGVLKGAFIFLADLVRELTIPAKVDFVRLSSYGSGTTSSGEIRISTDVELNLHQRDVLIVEDIVDSGRTMVFLREHLLSCQPRSLKICALLDKRERREWTVEIDYVAMRLEKGFVIGYGLDCNEAGRHLPDICELI